MELTNVVGNVYAPPGSDLPNVTNYCFVLKKKGFDQKTLVHQGQYIGTFSEEGFVVGIISEIISQNKYYSDPGMLKELSSRNINIEQYIPAQNWDLVLVFVSVQNYIPNINSEKDLPRLNERNWFHTIKTAFPSDPGLPFT